MINNKKISISGIYKSQKSDIDINYYLIRFSDLIYNIFNNMY